MPNISIQFHCSLLELRLLVAEWIESEDLHLAALRLNPYTAFEVRSERLEKIFGDSSVRRLVFFKASPDLSAKTLNEFSDKNPDRLTLEIGRLSSEGLKESWLTAREGIPDVFQVWRRIATNLKKATSSGAVAFNPANGATSKIRSHRYTPGALELQLQGHDILPAAGNSKLDLRKRPLPESTL